MDDKKKSIWYKIGKALQKDSSPETQMLIADPSAQLGYNLGTIIVEFFQNIDKNELNKLFEDQPVLIADPQAQLGYLLGEDLAIGVKIMKEAYNEVELTPDEIDAENEARAAEISKADGVAFQYQRREDLARQRETEREKSVEELQDAAYLQYKEDGSIDNYLQAIAEIESEVDIS